MAEMLEVHVNFGEANEASAVAREAVEQRLAACANIHGPIRSLYWWDGAVQSGMETAVVFKTSAEAVDDLVGLIAARHSYEVPSIVVHSPVRAHAPYLEWIARETRRSA
jgi:periplasmic divalent cation tolerance protein